MLGFLQALLSLDALVGQDELLCTVQVRLRALEGLLRCLQLRLLLALKASLRGCKLLASLPLSRGKLLGTGLQTEFVLLAGIELATDINCRLVGHGAVAIRGCVRRGDWGGLLQHGGNAGTLVH